MTRVLCLLFPVALLATTGCCHMCGGDPDPTPTHTFGHDGVVERGGGLRGPREFCPMCEWAGTKCAACRAKEAAECSKCKAGGTTQVAASKQAPVTAKPADAVATTKPSETKKLAPAEAQKAVKSAKSNPKKVTPQDMEEPDDGGLVSPYAPIRAVVHSTR